MWFDDTGLPWVMPSPNMPTLATATVYPGTCLLEGTNISEGRGTPPLPSRAFADQRERERVEAIVTRVTQRGRYTAADDAEFEKLAHERVERMPIRTSLLRLWHATHNWINIENPSPLLDLLPCVRQIQEPVLVQDGGGRRRHACP